MVSVLEVVEVSLAGSSAWVRVQILAQPAYAASQAANHPGGNAGARRDPGELPPPSANSGHVALLKILQGENPLPGCGF